ncbi:MAG TPA: adenosine deaminase [Acidimicrobiia bacterium]|nr:adenosine deaminase [Acidimicrobiia bacterium]
MHRDDLRVLPKVLLHEHLDGGLRPGTLLELADACRYPGLPRDEPESLATWFDQRGSGSLVRYLEAFAHTVAVMQTPDALARVAREEVEDLAADGVVYAEVRFAPSLHLQDGLSRSEVIAAVLEGTGEGVAATGIEVRIIVDAMRHDTDAEEVVAAAAPFLGRGVVGFDLAGPEAGFPAREHRRAIDAARDAGFRLTIHAGEADGPSSIADALDCGAERIGHGVRIIDDCRVRDGEVVEAGPVAARVVLQDAALEICPTSNLGTGAFPSASAHPIGMLHRAGFPVTINTDNRLMSRTSMTDEFGLVVGHHAFELGDLRAVTLRAVDAAFCDDATRSAVRRRVEAGYDPLS